MNPIYYNSAWPCNWPVGFHCHDMIMRHAQAALHLNWIAKLLSIQSHWERLYVFSDYSVCNIVLYVRSESTGNGLDQTWSCFVWSHRELYLHRSCKMGQLSCLVPLTQPFFRYLITFRGIVPPLANLPVCSVWSPVNRTYQTKYLIRTRPAAKDEALRGRLRALWLQT